MILHGTMLAIASRPAPGAGREHALKTLHEGPSPCA